eukprot:9078895-Prorocentrum_lima.AAC.1
MEKSHEHDTQGDEEWQKFYLGVQTENEGKCPLDEPLIIDCVKPDDIKINTVKCKTKYWIEPSCDGAGP